MSDMYFILVQLRDEAVTDVNKQVDQATTTEL